MNIEIQRADTITMPDGQVSIIDSEHWQKGKTYIEMPDVHIIYISETDKTGHTTLKHCLP